MSGPAQSNFIVTELIPPPFLTLQIAVYPFGLIDNSLGHLLLAGCISNGTRNCSTACTQPRQVFGNFSTWLNCLSYLQLINWPANSRIYADAERKSVLNRTLGEDYGIGGSNPNNRPEIFKVLQSCFEAFGQSFIDDPKSRVDLLRVCDHIPTFIDPDIRGIGVRPNESLRSPVRIMILN